MYKEDCPSCIGDGYYDLDCDYCEGRISRLELILRLEGQRKCTTDREQRAIAAFGSMPIPEGADVGALVKIFRALLGATTHVRDEHLKPREKRTGTVRILTPIINRAEAELDKWKE